MIPTRVVVALETLGILRGEDEEDGMPNTLSRPELAAARAAAEVVRLYLAGDNEFKDVTPRRARKRARRNPPRQGRAVRR